MSLIDLTPPLAEPIDLAFAKTFLRVDGSDDDVLIERLIKTSRHRIETMIGRTLIRRSFIYRCDVPSHRILTLPRPPALAVTRMTLVTDGDVAVDIPPADYKVSTRKAVGEVRLVTGKTWTDYLADFCTLEIEFEAGYGDTSDHVPLPIRQAILLLVAHSFEYRSLAETPAVPSMVDALLASYKCVRL